MNRNKGLQLVKSTRARTLTLVEGLSQADLDYSPAPGKWSVGEVLDHLVLSDQIYYGEVQALFELKKAGKRPYLQRGFADIDASILFIPKFLLPFTEIPFHVMNLFLPRAVRTFFISSRLIPAQTPNRARPRPGRSGEALRQELQAAPAVLEALMARYPHADYREFIHYHPLLGANNLFEILEFLTNHETVHQKQIREIIAALKR